MAAGRPQGESRLARLRRFRRLYQNLRLAGGILRGRLTGSTRLLSVQLMLNYTCNQACKYCCKPNAKELMKPAELEDILRRLRDAGTVQISYAGGEPTIHPDFEQIMRLTRRLGFHYTVSTNGFNSRPLLELEDDLVPDLVSVSIDGPPEIHDLYRGKRSGRKALAMLAALSDRGVPLAMNAVIGRHNCEIDCVKWLLAKADELKASFNFQFMLPLAGVVEENPCAPSPEAMRDLLEAILALPRSAKRRLIFGDHIVRRFLGWESTYPPYKKNDNGRKCYAGQGFAFITPSGFVAPCCLLLDHPLYQRNTLSEAGFQEAFRRIRHIPCDDCYLGCNNLRNDILSMKPRTLFGTVRMTLGL